MLQDLTLLVATVTTGLAAGLFFTFSIAVMPGLRRTDDATFVSAMRAVNRAILNGWFALAFGGALVFSVVALVVRLAQGEPSAWVTAAVVGYVLCLLVTFVVNVPLNDALDGAGHHAADPAAVRRAFEARWVRWNHVRTLTSAAALACLAWAAIGS